MAKRTAAATLLGALVTVATLAACGSSSKSSAPDGATHSGAATTAAAAAPAAGFASGDASTAATAPSAAASAAVLDRKVITTITVEVRVTDVAAATLQATTLAEGAGGYVFTQQSSLTGRASSTLVLKVPPDRTGSLLEALSALGKVQAETRQSDDVTAQYVDLDARITTARISVSRVQGFLDKTTNVVELASIEAELTRRQTELEQLLGQQRVLDAKIGLATITVTLTTTERSTARTPSIARALRRGTDSLLAVGHGIGLVGAFILPWLAPVAIVTASIMYWARRRRRRRAAEAEATPASTTGLPPPKP